MSSGNQAQSTLMGIKKDELITFIPIAIVFVFLLSVLLWHETQQRITSHSLDFRGTIYDCTGIAITQVEQRNTATVDLKNLRKLPREIWINFSREASKALRMNNDQLAVLFDKKSNFAFLKRSMSVVEYSRLKEALEQKRFAELERVIGFIREPIMTYPHDQLLAPLIGFVGRDADGLEGLQRYYERGLQGRRYHGKSTMGYDLHLTIDLREQKKIEELLSRAMIQHQASEGQAVLLRVADSSFVALASLPSYNPNSVQQARVQNIRLRPVTDQFQFGPMAYPLYAAQALETKGLWGAARAAFLSSDPDAGKLLLQQIGADGMYSKFEQMQIAARTGIDFSGETPRSYRKHLSPREFEQEFAPGYGIAASLIRLAVSSNSMINGGELRRPHFVNRFHNGWDSVDNNIPPPVRAISEQASAEMRKLLVEFMAKNGRATDMGGYWEAHNSNELAPVRPNHIVSGLFFTPANKPKYILLVKLQLPEGPVLPGDREIPLQLGREMLAAVKQ